LRKDAGARSRGLAHRLSPGPRDVPDPLVAEPGGGETGRVVGARRVQEDRRERRRSEGASDLEGGVVEGGRGARALGGYGAEDDLRDGRDDGDVADADEDEPDED